MCVCVCGRVHVNTYIPCIYIYIYIHKYMIFFLCFVVLLHQNNNISVTYWRERRRNPDLTHLPPQGFFNLPNHISLV